jgi:hypothetical protein
VGRGQGRRVVLQLVTVRVAIVILVLGVAAGCGGQSLSDAGAGGTTGGGGGTTGGSGGTTGGSGGTTGGTGGTMGGAGGTMGGTGGTTGGTGGTTGGTGGTTAGTGGVIIIGGTGGATGGSGGSIPPECLLPLETGPCDAYFTRYGFNPKTNRCENFVYGGCGANANNFESLAACEAACPAADCPPTVPSIGSPCDTSALCEYHPFTGCLCGDGLTYPCTQADPTCTGPQAREVPPGGSAGACSDCPAEIVIPSATSCTCTVTWACSNFR